MLRLALFAAALQLATPAAAAPPPESAITLAITGDVSLTWRGYSTAWRTLPPGANPLLPLKPLFDGVDLAVANAEAVFMRVNPRYADPQWNLWVPAAGAQAFTAAGIDLVTTANNHAWDGRAAGVVENLAHLRATGVKTIGTGATAAEARHPFTLRKGDACVTLIAATTKVNRRAKQAKEMVALYPPGEDEALLEQVRAARRAGCLAIPYVHWGKQFKHRPLASMQRLAHALVDAGATLVVGHHPHVLGAVEHYKGVPIAYTLGNLVFSTPYEITRKTGILHVTLNPEAAQPVAQLELIPIYIKHRRYLPQPATDAQTRTIARELASYSEGFNTRVQVIDGRIRLLPDVTVAADGK
jgi:poly-gamma-glutamate synthesis protein (capsule biosynthesis protein)